MQNRYWECKICGPHFISYQNLRFNKILWWFMYTVELMPLENVTFSVYSGKIVITQCFEIPFLELFRMYTTL